jgi:N-carbamoylputrescine amidase
MVGHAVSNLTPVVAANRTGVEGGQSFYGHTFISDHFGDVLAELGDAEEGVIVQELDLAEAARRRAAFGFFRDRRPDLYARLARDE